MKARGDRRSPRRRRGPGAGGDGAGRGPGLAEPGKRTTSTRTRRLAFTVGAGTALTLAVALSPFACRLLREGAAAGLPSSALADSANVATTARDWERAIFWANMLARREPTNPSVVLGLAAATNNLTWGGGRYERARTPTRTSLDRMRIRRRAIALVDSATALARSDEMWARARQMLGEFYENDGMPVDAFEVYADILRRSPNFAPARGRAAWVAAHLRHPVDGTGPASGR